MSTDNYILIRKEKDQGTGANAPTGRVMIKYVGYDESASLEEPTYSRPVFFALTLEDAILHAQRSETEYGYRFEGIGDDVT